MIEPNWDSVTEEELWKYVGYFLKKNKIDTVLVGDAVAAIYSLGVYRSGDLDLVNLNNRDETVINKTLQDLGFYRKGKHFEHPICKHIFIEFVPPPLSNGSDYTIKPHEVFIEGIIIKILSPTDCIRDRLASYIFFDVRECMDQAVLVATKQKFDLRTVQDWCDKEGDKAKSACTDFVRILKQSRER